MNVTELNTLDKLVLLALDDETGSLVADSTVFGYALAGATIFELVKREKLDLKDEKLKVISSSSLGDEALDFSLKLIHDSKKEKKAKTWIETLGNKGGLIKEKVLNKLITKGIIEKREGKILWIFPNNKYPMKNASVENRIRKNLFNVVVNKAKPTEDEVMILSLVETCSLTKEVFGKDIAKEYKIEIKRIIKESHFAKDTGKLVKEVHETITAMLVIVMASAVVTTT